jgi:hypothetical protein
LVPRKLLFQERSLQTLLFVPRKLLWIGLCLLV